MYIQSLRLNNFRNYENLELSFSSGTNILYGNNAQGKTNILEALYMIATTHSYRGAKDRDLIRFGQEEGHIRTVLIKGGIDYQVDLHLRRGKTKAIAINEQRIRRASELIGLLHIVFFSPEDLTIVKNGPSYRRNFIDTELCQLDEAYLFNLSHYNKIMEQRNKLLHDIYYEPSLEITLDAWDQQLLQYGSKIIERRTKFMDQLNEVIEGVHQKLSGGREHLFIQYEPNTLNDKFEKELKASRERDKYTKSTNCGPHKDDFSFICNEVDLRRFGSQGQQRTCALSLKLSEIRMVTNLVGEPPVLMLDDVLSELDSERQNDLLNALTQVQTFITCTGLDEFVNNRFEIDSLYKVSEGIVSREN